MDDNDIIQLYWDRNEQAIRITSDKYGHYCKAIARNILNNEEDAEECVNDTYLNAWNSMPTHWPKQLETFLGKITRNLSFNKYKHDHAEKRGSGEITLVLDELTDCVSDTDNVEQVLDHQELIKAISSFVRSLQKTSGICLYDAIGMQIQFQLLQMTLECCRELYQRRWSVHGNS